MTTRPLVRPARLLLGASLNRVWSVAGILPSDRPGFNDSFADLLFSQLRAMGLYRSVFCPIECSFGRCHRGGRRYWAKLAAAFRVLLEVISPP
jgi:hypothetical protein